MQIIEYGETFVEFILFVICSRTAQETCKRRYKKRMQNIIFFDKNCMMRKHQKRLNFGDNSFLLQFALYEGNRTCRVSMNTIRDHSYYRNAK